jgi:hypothetical protein
MAEFMGRYEAGPFVVAGGVKIAAGYGATAVCIGVSIGIVIVAVGVFLWLKRKA